MGFFMPAEKIAACGSSYKSPVMRDSVGAGEACDLLILLYIGAG
ncbi:hypothetical protein [Pseudomonas sp. TH31]|nr:hypothetical protein [Pseudomonas sp. TH31]